MYTHIETVLFVQHSTEYNLLEMGFPRYIHAVIVRWN